MKKHVLVALLTALCCGARAQMDTGSFVLHKFQQAIGKESYTSEETVGGRTYTVDFSFTDRAHKVPLKATLTMTPAGEPLGLRIKGSTSRMTVIDDEVALTGQTARIKINDSAYSTSPGPLAFPVTGYAPVIFQQLLLEYWRKHGRPATLPLLPSGSVTIRQEGMDTINGVVLERYAVGGLIWGNEFVWTLPGGQLVCLVTIDAEADKFEATCPPYENLLPQLLKKAALYGVRSYPRSRIATGRQQPNLAFSGGAMVDVGSGRTIPRATVLVSNGLITAAGSADSIPIPKEYEVIHTDGKTMLPGLWDMHAHFEQVEWGPAYLGAGITTVRDCGNEFDFINAVQQAIDDGQGMGPHILKAGIIDGKGTMSLGVIQADNAAEAVAAVDRYKAAGFIQIKIYSSVKPEVVRAICTEAHRLGLTVTGHIPEGMTLLAGVDSGMDMVNHIVYVAAVLKRQTSGGFDYTDPKNKAVFQFLKDHHTVVDPTLAIFEIAFRSLADSITAIEPNFYTLPPVLQALFVNAGMDAKKAAYYKPVFQSWVGIVKVLHDYGIPIVAGTDEALPGYSLYREMELYVQAGLTPMEALQAATITPARVMGMASRSGSLSPGKDADLIVVDGSPENDIRQIRKVNLVCKKGVVYDPVALHRLVGFNL
ncbi:amidohydrolase family protein [Dinghuibacter silviterrae]|uniref:Imidazolonepropionase-like amidohydrolase n=1 Tax=Dinghuibacter silviterrae TaxID=1539049 RepID=A0A4R8DEY2_9BACT|nr:amidohydrolase family protein [Dinghuibacter silviterrae]TDW96121.1 imidazolonepropionase-like amidohydrolase [Dinghuibacter silviterrae]